MIDYSNTTINERISEICSQLFKGNVTAMARASYISRTTISSIIGEKEVAPGYEVLRKLGDMSSHSISMPWLIYGKGSMLNNDSVETHPRIPMSVAAGTLCGFADCVNSCDCEQIPVIKAFPKYDYTIIVKGDSMEPKFAGGDEIAISKVTDFIEWGKTYVLDTRDGAVLKRLYNADDKYRCVSYNNEYPDFEVRKSDVFGVYRVVGLIRVGI